MLRQTLSFIYQHLTGGPTYSVVTSYLLTYILKDLYAGTHAACMIYMERSIYTLTALGHGVVYMLGKTKILTVYFMTHGEWYEVNKEVK
jgi:hypothetical protein